MKFEMIQIFHARTTEEKQKKNCKIRPSSQQEGNEIRVDLQKLDKNAYHRHEAKLPIRILHLLAQVQVSHSKSKDVPTQMTKQSFTNVCFITSRRLYTLKSFTKLNITKKSQLVTFTSAKLN